MIELNICHLYPDILNLYGDRGNIAAMMQRLKWRGIGARLTELSIGQALDIGEHDIYFIGGGQDFEQGLLLGDLATGKAEAVRRAVEEGKVFLAICGGYQILGKSYITWDGKESEYIGAIDVHTVGKEERMIGNCMFRLTEENGGDTVVGFENHSGMTFLGEGARPLGEVLDGHGNNGRDKTEGARYQNVFCTYSHGPLLPKNPALCDRLLELALRRKYGDITLSELDDSLEHAANDYMRRRLEAARIK